MDCGLAGIAGPQSTHLGSALPKHFVPDRGDAVALLAGTPLQESENPKVVKKHLHLLFGRVTLPPIPSSKHSRRAHLVKIGR